MSMYSIKFYSDSTSGWVTPPAIDRRGYLFVLGTRKHLNYLRTNQAPQYRSD